MERLFVLGLANAVTATLLAVLLACLSRFLARKPAILHCLWLVVLLKLVTPALVEIPVPDLSSHEPSPLTSLQFEPTTESQPRNLTEINLAELDRLETEAETDSEIEILLAFEPDQTTSAITSFWHEWREPVTRGLCSIWLLGTVFTLAIAWIRVARFRRLLREAYSADDDVYDQGDALAHRLGLRRCPPILMIDAPLMPMLWAVGCRPSMILPATLWKTLDKRQRAMLMTHELAHLRRGDHWVRLFELAVTALFWWLPVVWWARNALRDAEEDCCDAWVVWAFPHDARSYAETLLDTVDFLNPTSAKEPLMACGFGRAHHLRSRLTMIMTGNSSRRLSWASALGAVAVSSILLPIAPTWARNASDDAKKTEDVLILQGDVQVTSDDAEKTEGGKVFRGEGIQFTLDEPKETREPIEVIKKDGENAQEVVLQTDQEGNVLLFTPTTTAMTDEEAKAAREEVQSVTIVVNNNDDEDAPTKSEVSAERKKAIEVAAKRVQELEKEVNQKNQQLREAVINLARLKGAARADTNLVFRKMAAEAKAIIKSKNEPIKVEGKQIVIKKLGKPQIADHQPKKLSDNERREAELQVKRLIEDQERTSKGERPKLSDRERHEAGIQANRLIKDQVRIIKDDVIKRSDKERIEALEKKLSELLEEVSSIKKEK